MHIRMPTALVIPLIFAALLPAGCGRSSGPDLAPEVARLNAELDATKQKLAATARDLAAKNDEIAKAAADAFAASATKKETEETGRAIAQKEAQLRALQAELADLKKRDINVYADASAVQAKGLTTIALDRYQQFVKTYPNSPLVTDANRAIAELTSSADREAKWRASVIDPKRPEHDALKHFNDGVGTVEELAPLLKRRSTAEVVKLLGKPNTSFRNGTEVGYVDRIIDSTTGNKDTLVVVFDEGRVTALRVGYKGRDIKP